MRFQWADLMRLGLRELGLSPQSFWALTPAELTLLLGRGGNSAPMARDRLEELARAYPDVVERTKNNG